MQSHRRPATVALVLLATFALGARKGDFSPKTPAACFAPNVLSTQNLSQGLTPLDLVNALLGAGVTASNVTYNGVPVAAGLFLGGTGIIGFDSGIILSSGCISNVIGPNVSESITCDNVQAGDADLSNLSGFTTFDASILEFDFVPTDPNGTTLLFSYVFSSDEYNEWVYSPYNDVFAFYVNGANCALVPGPTATPDPVTINTVNNGNPYASGNATNPLLYRNNSLSDGGGFIDTEMDGLTTVLTCQAAITPNATNHIKLAIADSSDAILDSNVFIRTGSLTPTDLGITLAPPSAVNPIGTPHTVTATVRNNLGVPQPGHEIFFSVISGPNAGATGTCSVNADCSTDDNGQVSFTYASGLTPGTDTIRACFDDAGGNENCSLAVTKTWVLPCGPDGTPCGNPPAECELQDTCLSNVCHHNGFKPATTECRPVAGPCDLAEFCTGADPTCPLDQHAADGTSCSDGNPCTAGDTCTAGACGGNAVPPPLEVDNAVQLEMTAGSAIVSWNLAAGATSSDVLRGRIASLPVGPCGGDETCLGGGVGGTRLTDGADPGPGGCFWYIVRGVSPCGVGTYGYRTANGTPTVERVSTTCP